MLTFPGSVDGPWTRYVKDADARGIGTVHYPRLVPVDAAAARELKKRTLTDLYNASPAWLVNAHRALDEAVAAAYGFPVDIEEDELLGRLLEMNQQQGSQSGAQRPLATRSTE